jgi:hypothetical protein
MKNLSFASIAALSKEVGLVFLGIASLVIGALMRMPLPRLLAVCLVAALVVMVLPMALTLFILALIVKLVAAGVILASRHRGQQPQLEHRAEE